MHDSAYPMSLNEELPKMIRKRKVDESVCWSLVASLVYLKNARRDKPSKTRFAIPKCIVWCVQSTKHFEMLYKAEEENKLNNHIYNDLASATDDRKSMSGFLFFYGTRAISESIQLLPRRTHISYNCEVRISLNSLNLQDLEEQQMPLTNIYYKYMSAIFKTKMHLTDEQSIWSESTSLYKRVDWYRRNQVTKIL